MANAFVKVSEDAYSSQLEHEECDVLLQLVGHLVEILEAGQAVPLTVESEVDSIFNDIGMEFGTEPNDKVPDPIDPISARLFPPGYSGDEESARDFRRFTEPDLRRQKIENATMFSSAISAAKESTSCQVTVEADEATKWLRGLNDLRITIAVQLGIGDPDEVQKARQPQMTELRNLYDFLTWWQDSLLRVLMQGSDEYEN